MIDFFFSCHNIGLQTCCTKFISFLFVCVLLPQMFFSIHLSLTLHRLLQSSVECLRENLYSLTPQSMTSQLEALVERTEDFTDSAYTSHEQRQAILGLCQLARQDTQQLVHAWVEAVCQRKHTFPLSYVRMNRLMDRLIAMLNTVATNKIVAGNHSRNSCLELNMCFYFKLLTSLHGDDNYSTVLCVVAAECMLSVSPLMTFPSVLKRQMQSVSRKQCEKRQTACALLGSF